jgi:hypothetical protein
MLSILAPVMSLYQQLCAWTPLPQSAVSFYSWIYSSMGAEQHPNRFVAIHSVLQHCILFYAAALPLLALDVFQAPKVRWGTERSDAHSPIR